MEKLAFCWCLTFVFMMHIFSGGIFLLWGSSVRYETSTFFRENLQKIVRDLFQNFDVSLGTTMFCISLLKSQRFAQFLCPLMRSRWFNFLVNHLSVVKNFTRFCFSVQYALCIEKHNDKKNIKKSPTFLP